MIQLLKLIVVLYSRQLDGWKIADFGTASQGTSERCITTIYSRGTASYRAPELLSETPFYNNKSDIWAVGCIMYEVIATKKAFKDDWGVLQYRAAPSAVEIPINHERWAFENLADGLDTVLLSMLDVNYLKRPPAKEVGHVPQLVKCVHTTLNRHRIFCSDFGSGVAANHKEVVIWKPLAGRLDHVESNWYPKDARYETYNAITLSRNDQYLAYTYSSEIVIWELKLEQMSWPTQVARLPVARAQALIFGHSSSWAASYDGFSIIVWKLDNFTEPWCRFGSFQAGGQSDSVRMHAHSDDIHLYVFRFPYLSTYNVATKCLERSIVIDGSIIPPVLISALWISSQCDPLSTNIVVVGLDRIIGIVHIVDIETDSLSRLKPFPLPGSNPNVFGISRCQKYILCGYRTGHIEVRSLSRGRQGEVVCEVQGGGPVYSLDLSISGDYLLSQHTMAEAPFLSILKLWRVDLKCKLLFFSKTNASRTKASFKVVRRTFNDEYLLK